jgi:hypothetical protein
MAAMSPVQTWACPLRALSRLFFFFGTYWSYRCLVVTVGRVPGPCTITSLSCHQNLCFSVALQAPYGVLQGECCAQVHATTGSHLTCISFPSPDSLFSFSMVPRLGSAWFLASTAACDHKLIQYWTTVLRCLGSCLRISSRSFGSP